MSVCVLNMTADAPIGARLTVSSCHPDDATCLCVSVCTGDVCEQNDQFEKKKEKTEDDSILFC